MQILQERGRSPNTPLAYQQDWQQFLGSPFGNHACGSKSKRQPHDIRKKLIALEAKKARRYPASDLIPARKTLGQVLETA